MTVRVLAPEVANRIAAGEVVERPASVVKELVENALDAGARRILVESEEGGLKLLRITDDGAGMGPDDLARSVLPHATSKILDVDDLFSVATYGFRGEALPSIASVSRMEITTRAEGAPLGSRLLVEGGTATGPIDAGAPFGTTVEVRNLFFNVPARRKFMKSERSEQAAIVELLTRMALSETGFALEYRTESRKVLDIPSSTSRRARIASVIGASEAERLLESEGARGSARLHALHSPVDMVAATKARQHLFVNGRWIRDRKLSVAIAEAYRGLIMPKDNPVAYLWLSVDPAEVDVNVHPTKTEVRFRDPDALFSLIVRTLRDRLGSVGGAHRLSVGSVPWATLRPQESSSVPPAPARPMEVPEGYDPGPMPWDLPADSKTSAPAGAPSADGVLFASETPAPRFLQMHRSYVVVEGIDGIRILDQHALHERKLFDELMQRIDAREARDQLLLVPEIHEAPPSDIALLLDNAEALKDVGLAIEPFGHAAIALRSVPLPLRRMRPADVIKEVLGVLREGGRTPTRAVLVADVVATLACKAAVKFGDRLPEPEVEALVRHEQAHPEARNCPHGRNTAVEISLRDLEVRFQRKK